VYCNQAASAIEQDRPETALTAAQAAYAADPHWVLPIVNQLSALALQGAVDTAWQVLTQALSQWPEGRQDPELHPYLAKDGLRSVLRTDPRFQQWLASTNPSIGDHYHA
jgi:predicted Zn-dependent protease